MPVRDRAKYLFKIADLLEARLEEFARAESTDQGKPVWLAQSVDIPRAVTNFRQFAEAVPHIMEKYASQASHLTSVSDDNFYQGKLHVNS